MFSLFYRCFLSSCDILPPGSLIFTCVYRCFLLSFRAPAEKQEHFACLLPPGSLIFFMFLYISNNYIYRRILLS